MPKMSVGQPQVSVQQKGNVITMKIPMRGFSSLPDFMKLEMPNLSPTMEKVSQPVSITQIG